MWHGFGSSRSGRLSLIRIPWKPLVAVLVGLVAAGSGYLMLNRQVQRAAAAPATVPVLVAARTVPAFQVIREEDLRFAQMPAGVRPDWAIGDPREALGKVASTTILPGEPIRRDRLMDSPLVLGPGERAIAIPSDLVRSVGASVMPGDRVDVLWVTSPDVPPQRLASGAVVLDLRSGDGRSLIRPERPAGAASVVETVRNAAQEVAPPNPARPTAQVGQSIPAAVVLKVTESEAVNVARGLAGGQIVLSKRQ